jgi:hypothetical protein
MRFLGILALSAGGLWLGSCSDDGGGGTANDDISWYVGCAMGSCGSGRTYHDQNMYPKPRFKVTCKKIGTIIEFTITDPGADDNPDTTAIDPRPGSQIEVSNGDPNARTCDVTVRDYPNREATAPLEFIGKCAASSTTPTCTMTGEFNKDGWVWVGTLQCDSLELRNSGAAARYTLTAAPAQGGGPVKIAVDNCE